MTLAIVSVRMHAQDTGDGAASKGYANFEGCCERGKIGPNMKVGAYYKTAAGIFRGKLKLLNNKEIVIENDSKQMVSIRRSHKTKFLRNNLEIKPSEIDLETPVTIDATESASVSLLAVNVSVDSCPNRNRPEVDCPANIPLPRRGAITP
jgi:hypothetical protein